MACDLAVGDLVRIGDHISDTVLATWCGHLPDRNQIYRISEIWLNTEDEDDSWCVALEPRLLSDHWGEGLNISHLKPLSPLEQLAQTIE